MQKNSVNKVILVGNLGKDPEIRQVGDNTMVANFSIATTEVYRDRDGQTQEKTEWHNITVWRKLAEIAEKFLSKGRQVYVEGKLQTRSYDDKEGQKRYITEVVAHELIMLGSKKDHDTGMGESSHQRPGKPKEPVGKTHDEPVDNPQEEDDDLPF